MELTNDEMKVVEAMKALKATSPDGLKTVDHITRQSRMPKGKVANIIANLMRKGVIKRVAREKAAGYYLI